MFLSAHTTFALALAQLPLPWWLVFFLSFFSHFLLDFIPHGDENIIKKNQNKKQTLKQMLAIALIDFLFVLVVLLFFASRHKLNYFIAGAVLLAILPDGLEFLNILTDKKYKTLNKFSRFHHFIHNWPKIKYPLLWGLALQVALILFLIIIFF